MYPGFPGPSVFNGRFSAKSAVAKNKRRKVHIVVVIMYTELFLLSFGLVIGTTAFPDGAPVDACVKARPNQPNHGRARPQPPETNPFQILQSQAEYGPGSQITGRP